VLEKWTRLVVRARFVVLTSWLIIAIIGLFAGLNLNSQLSTSLTVPGSQSAQADLILREHFNENTEGTFTVLFNFKSATKDEIESFKQSTQRAAQVIPGAEITQSRAFGGILFTSIGTSFALIDAASYTEKLRIALISEGLSQSLVTGPPAIYKDVTPVLANDLKEGQFIALILALILLLLVMGTCWAVSIPFIFAGVTIAASLGVVFLLAHKILMVLYIPNIIELIGLGLAIDYSLLIVHRFRREIISLEKSGSQKINIEEAIVSTMETAGRTVILSGLSVSIGLATLLLVPVPFVRSLGAAGLVVPVISIIAALTLQPALLSVLGSRGVTPKLFKGLIARKDLAEGVWAKIARFVIRKPLNVFLSSIAVLAIFASAVGWLQVTPSSLTAIPKNLESARAIDMVTERAGSGVITPHEIVIDLGAPSLATSSVINASRLAFAGALLKNPEIFIAATDQTGPYVDSTGRYMRIFVIGHHNIGDKETQKLVRDLRSKYIPAAGFPAGTNIYLGGAPAQGVDLIDGIFTSFPWVVLFMLFVAYVVLLRAFKSLILPLKAILLDLISIAVAFGSLVLVFRFGAGASLLNTYRLDQIEAWVLIFLFVVLFGLSMDYEVFIVSRMREAWDRGTSNSEAIIEGLSHTGGVVTAAAVILVGALSGLVFGHFAGLQQLGVGLAMGVLIDATIIRGLLLPSTMVLLGKWNWWLPESIAKLTKTKASPLENREIRP
jgi:uncharacterized membrane protein YdfJ with MMPL/SSD domain